MSKQAVTTYSDVLAASAAEEAARAAYVNATPTEKDAALTAWEAADEEQLATIRRYKKDRAAGLVGPN